VLVEALDRLLVPYPESLQKAALSQLEGLGVEVILNKSVKHVSGDHVLLSDGETIHTHTLIWAAGVKASPIADFLGIELQRGGRIPVHPTLEVVDREHIYAAGDISYLTDDKGQPYPQVIPVAQQQGRLVAENI